MSKKNLKFPQIDRTDNPDEVKRKLIELFGVDEDKKLSILHLIACAVNRKSEDQTKKIFDYKSMKQQLRQLNDYGESALHLACSKRASIEVINKITDVGGLELVLERDSGGYTALHNACICKASSDNIEFLLKVGGRDLVMASARCGRTALHWACFHDVSYDIIHSLVELGGKDLVMATDTNKRKALHIATVKRASIATIRHLVEIGGKDLLICENPLGPTYGNLFLHFFIATGWCCCQESTDKLLMLILKGLEYNIGGEFAVGGLLNTAPDEIQKHIFDCWIGRLDHVLQEVLKKHPKVPLMQSAIIAKAPRGVIQNLIETHEGVIALHDSKGRYPLDVAVEEDLPWDQGLKDVFNASMKLSMNSARYSINVAALHSLRWDNGLQEVAKNSTSMEESAQYHYLDEVTKLYPFMLAALGPNSDLDSTFELMRKTPELVTDLHKSV